MNALSRRLRVLCLLGLGLVLVLAAIPSNGFASSSLIQSSDFQSQSFSKTVDWYDYVRQYAAANNFPAPDPTQHAYIYANYVNTGGFQLFYTGLVNATDNGKFVTIPLQTFFEHFRTQNGKDAITASSFISLVAFRENSSSIYPNSPDAGDEVYASFSLGVNLTALTGHKVPSYVASTQIIPLVTTDNLHWTWGLKYTNLNAIWWRVGVNPLLPYWDQVQPRGLAQYSELTFNYALTLDPASKTASLTASHTIGRITDLWLLTANPAKHLNSTGTYNLNGSLNNTQTVNQFLDSKQFELSIVLSQKAILASHSTSDTDDSGSSVDRDAQVDVSHAIVNTKADDGERVFKTDFSVKPTYKLYNYTSDPTETSYVTGNVNVRTVNRQGWAGNPVFRFQNLFVGFLPVFVVHVDPGLVSAAKAGLVDFTTSDYLYVISYPTWDGHRINNDPSFTAFYQPADNSGLVTSLFIAVAVAAAAGTIFTFLFRRRRAAGLLGATPTTTGPSPIAGPPGPSR